MSQSDEAEYREGVVLNKPVKEGRGSFVNVGLPKEVQIDRHLDAGLRVTVKMKPSFEGMCLLLHKLHRFQFFIRILKWFGHVKHDADRIKHRTVMEVDETR